jgi:cytochrome c peroxidase
MVFAGLKRGQSVIAGRRTLRWVGRWRLLATVAWLVCGNVPAGAAGDEPVRFTPQEVRRILQHSPLPTPPPDPTNAFADNADAAALGARLFEDKKLSRDGSVSCTTCHDPQRAFTDGRRVARGLRDGVRNTPTLLNAAHFSWYFWDGRSDSLWSQALHPLENDAEMGGSRVDIARRVAGEPDLRRRYEATFGPLPDLSDPQRFPPGARPGTRANASQPVRDAADAAWNAMAAEDREAVTRVFVHVGKALAAFQRTLVSRESPFDRFAARLREAAASGGGDGIAVESADFPPAAQRGLRLFIGPGNCRSCHSGPLFSDGEFHAVRVPPADGFSPDDPGRFAGLRAACADEFAGGCVWSDDPAFGATKLSRVRASPELWGLYKTPSLREVARTAPYMHQGQFETLDRVIRHYSTFENALPLGHHPTEITLQPLNLSEPEIAELIAFLETLSSDVPAAPQADQPSIMRK